MTWLGIILWIVIHIPDFIAIIQAIINLLKGASFNRRNAVRITISDAIQTGDVALVKTVITTVHKQLLLEAA